MSCSQTPCSHKEKPFGETASAHATSVTTCMATTTTTTTKNILQRTHLKKNVIGYESARRNTKFYYCKEKNNDHWSLNTIGNRPKKFDLIFSPDWRARMVCTELEQGLTMQLPLPQETTDLS